MEEFVKSIRVGAVDFFGIIIPGVLLLSMSITGCFIPLLLIISGISGANIDWQAIYSENSSLILFVLVIFSYVLGYILRLSSPDELDRISAREVIKKERKIDPNFKEDGWPFNPEDEKDKYPYSNFREYLVKRGHVELTKKLVTWCPDDQLTGDKPTWEGEKGPDGKAILKTKRSKTDINKMKMKVRVQCPELSALIESKEGHIRLMAGTWTAFNLSMIFIGITFLFIGGVWIFHAWADALHPNYCPLFLLIDFSLLLMMALSNWRITKLFHYRRVSELFHIVQAAYDSEQWEKEHRTAKPLMRNPG